MAVNRHTFSSIWHLQDTPSVKYICFFRFPWVLVQIIPILCLFLPPRVENIGLILIHPRYNCFFRTQLKLTHELTLLMFLNYLDLSQWNNPKTFFSRTFELHHNFSSLSVFFGLKPCDFSHFLITINVIFPTVLKMCFVLPVILCYLSTTNELKHKNSWIFTRSPYFCPNLFTNSTDIIILPNNLAIF